MDRLSVDSDLNKILDTVIRLTVRAVIRLTLPVCCLTVSQSQAQVNVLTANYDNDRTNANLQETVLTQSNVNNDSFGKIGAFPVDGAIFAQPLYVTAVQIPPNSPFTLAFLPTIIIT